ncbi:Lrp/AsnC family transcriptional regulator [Chloroflexota bacterium]
MGIDLLGEELIKLLAQDGRESTELLAKKLKVTPSTIRRRLNELIKKGLVRIIAVVDPKKVGYPLAAVVAYDVENDKLDSAMKLLASLPEVTWVSTTTGRFDIISIMRFDSTDGLNEFINKVMVKIEGLKDSETFVCLHEGKGNYSMMYTKSS